MRWLAALDGTQLRLARVTPGGIESLDPQPADGVTTLAVGRVQGKMTLLAARGTALLRFDGRNWIVLGMAPASIRQVLPAEIGDGAALLTGSDGTPVPRDGAVWWATWEKAFTCTRVTAVKAYYRPWQLWWARLHDEPCLAAATYKATTFAKFEHNCMFLFAWQHGTAEPRWLGSRLTQPYVDATHAPLRGSREWRMVAVEITRDDRRNLGVYQAIGFGYGNEWHSTPLPGLERVAAFEEVVVAWGRDADGRPLAWRVLPAGSGYRLALLPTAPPSLEALARFDADHLAGWWDGDWHIITLPAAENFIAP